MHTYSIGKSATQIDFILTASEAADGMAKNCALPCVSLAKKQRPARHESRCQYDLLMSDEVVERQFFDECSRQAEPRRFRAGVIE